jgi:TonB-dependent receptor
MTRQQFRAFALASSGLAVATMGQASALAQTGPVDEQAQAQGQGVLPPSQNAAADTSGEIVVDGIRQQLLRSAQLEREADNVVNVITADQLGQFPDETFAESIARLPGVTVIQEEGEGRFVRIRGLSEDFSQVTLNNAQLGSSDANGGRSVALDVIPSDLFSRAEVGKTLFPDTDHDSLGAKLDLRPLSAFDSSKDKTGRVTVEGAFTEGGSIIAPRVNGSLTRRFDLGGGEFGVAVGLSYREREVFGDRVRTSSGNSLDRRNAPAIEGGILYTPAELDARLERGRREQIGGTLTLDFQTDNSRYQLGGIFGRLKDDDLQLRQEVEFLDAVQGREFVIERPGAARFSDIDIQRQVFFLPSEETTWAVHFEGENRFADDAWTLSYALDYSRNDFAIRNGSRVQWELNGPIPDSIVDAVWGRDFVDFTYVGAGELQRTFDLNFRPTMADFRVNSILVTEEDRSDEVYSGNIDLERRLQLFDREVAIKFGGKYRKRDRIFAVGEFPLGFSAAELNGFDAAGLTTRLNENADLSVPSSTLRLDGGVDGLGAFPSFEFSRNLVNSLIAETGITPTESRQDFSAAEETLAGYVMASIDLTSKLRLVTGVRYEHTGYDTTGLVVQDAQIALLDGIAGNGNPIERIEQFGTTGGPAPVVATSTNDYDGFFPAAHLRWDATDKLVMRFGLSRAQVRPSFGDASGLTTNIYRLTDAEFGVLDDPDSCTGTVTATIGGAQREVCDFYIIESSGGNPQLRPTRANQIDFNLGWYPDQQSNLVFAFFYKDLTDVFLRLDTTDRDTIALLNPADAIDPLTGLAVTRLQKVINAGSGYVAGIELSGNHSFSYLPGILKHLFIDGNMSMLRGETRSDAVRGGESFELPNQPRLIANLGLGYEDKKFTFRATMDYRGKLLRTIDPVDPARDTFTAERFNLGLTARYNINKNLRLLGSVANLTNERAISFFRSDEASGPVFSGIDFFGRTWRLGVNLRF